MFNDADAPGERVVVESIALGAFHSACIDTRGHLWVFGKDVRVLLHSRNCSSWSHEPCHSSAPSADRMSSYVVYFAFLRIFLVLTVMKRNMCVFR